MSASGRRRTESRRGRHSVDIVQRGFGREVPLRLTPVRTPRCCCRATGHFQSQPVPKLYVRKGDRSTSALAGLRVVCTSRPVWRYAPCGSSVPRSITPWPSWLSASFACCWPAWPMARPRGREKPPAATAPWCCATRTPGDVLAMALDLRARPRRSGPWPRTAMSEGEGFVGMEPGILPLLQVPTRRQTRLPPDSTPSKTGRAQASDVDRGQSSPPVLSTTALGRQGLVRQSWPGPGNTDCCRCAWPHTSPGRRYG